MAYHLEILRNFYHAAGSESVPWDSNNNSWVLGPSTRSQDSGKALWNIVNNRSSDKSNIET